MAFASAALHAPEGEAGGCDGGAVMEKVKTRGNNVPGALECFKDRPVSLGLGSEADVRTRLALLELICE